MNKYILITGGAGYIGSHVNLLLNRSGYSTVVLDNLSRGSQENALNGIFMQGDLHDKALLESLFTTYSIELVMHFAAYTDIAESFLEPLRYFHNNVSATLNLLEMMKKYRIPYFIFSSSAAVYGIPTQQTITENHPCSPINPYGKSKLIIDNMLPYLEMAYGLKFCSLRYFNAAGSSPQIVFKRKESNLIPKLLNNLIEGNATITINGTDYPTPDGTCVRDYVHVNDISYAHLHAMERLFKGAPSDYYNLGIGKGFSVNEVIDAIEKVTKKRVERLFGTRRAGDPPILVANASKAAKEWNWTPKHTSLEEMIEHSWKALQNLLQ